MATPGTDTVPPTGDPLIDGLLEGGSWQFSGPRVLTYSLHEIPGHGNLTLGFTAAIQNAFSAWSAVAAAHTLSANIESLYLTGAGSINGTGNTLANVIEGNGGNNVLSGGAGVDTLTGGLGNDTYVIDNSGDVILELAGEGIDKVQSAVTYVLSGNFENLMLIGATAINGTGDGNDNAIGGNAAGNILAGADGNDTLNGVGGGDTLIGGLGDDIYGVDNGADLVTELSGEGHDRIESSISIALAAEIEDLLLLGTGAINGIGNDIDNLLTGNAGPNELAGGLGFDTLVGGAGNDIYVIGDNSDGIIELAKGGADLVKSSITFDLSLPALLEIENLTLTGADAIDGTGNGLANILTGNGNDNLLDGGIGADRMSGGAGDDIYVADSVADIVIETAGNGDDTIKSFVTRILGTEVERLHLQGGADVNATGNTLANELFGNSGNNVVNGMTGGDSMAGGGGNDTYIVDNLGDIVTELFGEGADTVQSAVSFILGAEIENLILTGKPLLSGTGNDLANALTGNVAANSLTGGLGDDTLNGGIGADVMTGGDGDDVYFIDNAKDIVAELAGEGSDTVNSIFSVDLNSAAFLDIDHLALIGAAAALGIGNGDGNLLKGNAAANTLDGRSGGDTMQGGAGNDTYVVDAIGDEVLELAKGGADLVKSGVTFDLGVAAHLEIEHLTLTGTDAIDGSGNGFANILTGNAGDNRLNGKSGNDRMIGGGGNDTYVVDSTKDIVIEGAGGGDDTLLSFVTRVLGAEFERLHLQGSLSINGVGNTLANELFGNSGNNILNGMTGADNMIAGAGNDTYVVDNLGDTVAESLDEGADLVQSSVSFTLGSDIENLALTGKGANSGAGNGLANSITGNGAANSLSGGLGDDTLNGGAGADNLTGGDGNDVYFIDNAKDAIIELFGEGDDAVNTSFTVDLNGAAFLNIENVTLIGIGAIAATGSNDANLLKGNGAANFLNGGGGDDTLDGGLGVDRLTGGAGSDHFLRHALNEGRDIITDFQVGTGGDALDISDLLVGFSSGNESQFVQCVQAAGNTTIRVDANGAAGGAFFTDVCVLGGQSVTLDALLADSNLVLG